MIKHLLILPANFLNSDAIESNRFEKFNSADNETSCTDISNLETKYYHDKGLLFLKYKYSNKNVNVFTCLIYPKDYPWIVNPHQT